MAEKKQDVVLDHDYDGIQEYDNQLPKWWLWAFYLTVIFGFFYWLTFHVYRWQPGSEEAYEQALAVHQDNLAKAIASQPKVQDSDIVALMKNEAVMNEAKGVFMANCLACHGAQAQGIIGPNLTDKYWIHGGHPSEIYQTIMDGVPAKGMLTWKGILTEDQIKGLTAYILTLKGTNPAGAKPPQGDPFEE